MKVLILGAGKMVSAILQGLSMDRELSSFYLYSPSGESARVLAQKVGASWISSLDELKSPDMVWLGFKPQQLKVVAPILSANLRDSLFVSFLAAVSEADQRNILGVDRLVRLMPNLNVAIQKGIVLASSQSAHSSIDKVQHLFQGLGLFHSVHEHELEELTLLSGSGPALMYEFAKVLAASFKSGTPEFRERLVINLLTSSGKMAELSEKKIDQLIDDVTSKGGVTIEVLNSWRLQGLESLVFSGIEAGKERGKAIASIIRQT